MLTELKFCFWNNEIQEYMFRYFAFIRRFMYAVLYSIPNINQVFMTPPKKLYKYVEPKRIDILKNNQIRFTQPSALNDPFEFQPMFEALFSDQAIADEQNNIPFSVIEEVIRNDYKKLSRKKKKQMPIEQLIQVVKTCPQFIPKLMEGFEPFIKGESAKFAPKVKEMIAEALKVKIGILSLSETIENPLLWAHYSSSHK